MTEPAAAPAIRQAVVDGLTEENWERAPAAAGMRMYCKDASWCVTGAQGESTLWRSDEGWHLDFGPDVPARIIIAVCRAAAEQEH